MKGFHPTGHGFCQVQDGLSTIFCGWLQWSQADCSYWEYQKQQCTQNAQQLEPLFAEFNATATLLLKICATRLPFILCATGYAPFSDCCPASDLPSLELCSVPLCTCTRSSVHPQYEVLAACERHCRGISAYRKHLEVHGPADSGPLEVQSRALCYWC